MQVLEAKRPLLPYPAITRVKKEAIFDPFDAARHARQRRQKRPQNCHESLI